MYIKFIKGKGIGQGRCFDYFKDIEFKLISLYFFHIRICPNKETYDNLPQCG
jgi:hypothetical protein